MRYATDVRKKFDKKNTIPLSNQNDHDETFASIAGYTSGGAPYGITWEEMAAMERAEVERGTATPARGRPVALADIAGEMEIMFDTMTAYFRRSTCEFVTVSDEYVRVVEEDGPIDDRPEWEQEAIAQAADVLADTVGDYVPLPSHYDIHEYAIMEDFCGEVEDRKVASDLFHAISGKGAFRRFKDAIRRHGVEEQWYRFRKVEFKRIACAWCEENGITWHD